jgi:hypothetical protein
VSDHAATNTGLVLGDGVYDVLRQFVEKVLPGFGALYFALAPLWEWPNADKVVATCAALAVFVGILLTLARKGYVPEGSGGDGDVVLQTDEEGTNQYLLQLNAPMDELVSGKSVISFKVQAPSA